MQRDQEVQRELIYCQEPEMEADGGMAEKSRWGDPGRETADRRENRGDGCLQGRRIHGQRNVEKQQTNISETFVVSTDKRNYCQVSGDNDLATSRC